MASITGGQYIDGEDPRGFLHVAEGAPVIWHSRHQWRWHAVRGQDIIPRHDPDVGEYIFRGDLLERQDLHTIFTTSRQDSGIRIFFNATSP